MSAVLKIVGVVILGLVGAALLFIAIFYKRIRGIFDTATNRGAALPNKIKVQPLKQAGRRHPTQIKKNADTLRELGFRDVGAYEILGLMDLRIMVMTHAGKQIAAIIYEREGHGLVTDFSVIYEDGGSLTVTNAPSGHNFAGRPGQDRIFQPERNAEENFATLMDRLEEARPRLLVTSENFPVLFENAYSRDVAWRQSQGGITREEIRRGIAQHGQDLTEEELEEAYDLSREQNVARLNEDCMDQFLEESRMPAHLWEETHYYMFVIHDNMEYGDLMAQLEQFSLLSKEQEDELSRSLKQHRSVVEAFRTFNESLAYNRSHPLGTVDFPVRAEIYSSREI